MIRKKRLFKETYQRASRVVAWRGAVRRAVTLSSGLDPNDRIDERRAGVCRRADTEASALDVAPVTPLLAEVLLARATLVDDEESVPALRLELGSEGLCTMDERIYAKRIQVTRTLM